MRDNAARRPRWRAFVPFAALLVLAVLLAPVFRRTPSTVIRAGFNQIQDGMTEDQVGELLGGPRGVYDKTRLHSTMTTAVGTGSGGSHLSWWYFPDCTVEVGFDEDRRVNAKRIEPLPRQSLLSRAARWCQ
jgi:hypothetical protein